MDAKDEMTPTQYHQWPREAVMLVERLEIERSTLRAQVAMLERDRPDCGACPSLAAVLAERDTCACGENQCPWDPARVQSAPESVVLPVPAKALSEANLQVGRLETERDALRAQVAALEMRLRDAATTLAARECQGCVTLKAQAETLTTERDEALLGLDGAIELLGENLDGNPAIERAKEYIVAYEKTIGRGRCSYCDFEGADAELPAHIKGCEKHPLAAVTKERDALKARLDDPPNKLSHLALKNELVTLKAKLAESEARWWRLIDCNGCDEPELLSSISVENHALRVKLAASEASNAAMRAALEPLGRWPTVYEFALAMVAKLDAHRPKKGGREGWSDDDPEDLLARVKEEVEELAVAIKRNTYQPSNDPALMEAADVANMAMMVADAFGVLHGLPIDALSSAPSGLWLSEVEREQVVDVLEAQEDSRFDDLPVIQACAKLRDLRNAALALFNRGGR